VSRGRNNSSHDANGELSRLGDHLTFPGLISSMTLLSVIQLILSLDTEAP
jgi:hypothetical protein